MVNPSGDLLFHDEAARFARACANAAGLGDRVEIVLDAPANALSISGPDHFGFLGTTTWRSLRVRLPAAPRAIATVLARLVFGEFYASDDEIVARANELPLMLAMALTGTR